MAFKISETKNQKFSEFHLLKGVEDKAFTKYLEGRGYSFETIESGDFTIFMVKEADESIKEYFNILRKFFSERRQAKKEEVDNMRNRLVNTGLTGNKNKEILDSALGQLSDGIWENSPGMDKYWRYADIEQNELGEVFISLENSWRSYFRDKDDNQVRNYFANKIKQIIKIEEADGYSKVSWDRNSKEVSDYIGYREQITVQDCYKAYETLKGRNISGRYNESFRLGTPGTIYPDYSKEQIEKGREMLSNLLSGYKYILGSNENIGIEYDGKYLYWSNGAGAGYGQATVKDLLHVLPLFGDNVNLTKVSLNESNTLVTTKAGKTLEVLDTTTKPDGRVIALLHWGKEYVVAYGFNEKGLYWTQGHYYQTLEQAQAKFDRYLMEAKNLNEDYGYVYYYTEEENKLKELLSKHSVRRTQETLTNSGEYKARIEGNFDDVKKVERAWGYYKFNGEDLKESKSKISLDDIYKVVKSRLRKGTDAYSLLDDIEASAWEYAYRKTKHTSDDAIFMRWYNIALDVLKKELKFEADIWKELTTVDESANEPEFVKEFRYMDYVVELFSDGNQYYWQADYEGEDRTYSNFNVFVQARGIELSLYEEKSYSSLDEAIDAAKEAIRNEKRKFNESTITESHIEFLSSLHSEQKDEVTQFILQWYLGKPHFRLADADDELIHRAVEYWIQRMGPKVPTNREMNDYFGGIEIEPDLPPVMEASEAEVTSEATKIEDSETCGIIVIQYLNGKYFDSYYFNNETEAYSFIEEQEDLNHAIGNYGFEYVVERDESVSIFPKKEAKENQGWRKDNKYSTGATVKDGQPVSYKDGYQVCPVGTVQTKFDTLEEMFNYVDKEKLTNYGYWYANKKFVLDTLSEHYEDLDKALEAAIESNQEAIYDWSTGHDIIIKDIKENYKSGDRYYGGLPTEPNDSDYATGVARAHKADEEYLNKSGFTKSRVGKYDVYTGEIDGNDIEIHILPGLFGPSRLAEIYINNDEINLGKSTFNYYNRGQLNLYHYNDMFGTLESALEMIIQNGWEPYGTLIFKEDSKNESVEKTGLIDPKTNLIRLYIHLTIDEMAEEQEQRNISVDHFDNIKGIFISMLKEEGYQIQDDNGSEFVFVHPDDKGDLETLCYEIIHEYMGNLQSKNRMSRRYAKGRPGGFTGVKKSEPTRF